MKIEAHLRDDEMMVTPIAFAEAVIDYFMGADCDIRLGYHGRKKLGEVIDYLHVFACHHPLRDYEPMDEDERW